METLRTSDAAQHLTDELKPARQGRPFADLRPTIKMLHQQPAKLPFVARAK
ncbi:hypothetical protein L0664_16210 [Octadecabacter sp. G9-8]|uniref:Transposase n=1 Tax=Octadecabacter dasysiphoniae TaxID=2909341 RepID=A0ABS9CZB0_9RHOB|nr:hypothetical protein [Octadecabacter dasysiphoniae]MCF2872616.1 hypothetical protein [Octadecabacter dasysiphoniae]